MISTTDISLSYGDRVIFKNVNIKFTPGNCYGLIGVRVNPPFSRYSPAR
jgi:ATPase subunit of ABC transporter with duplicated ATPase domains